MAKFYKLSACLYGHSLDVRALAVTKNEQILSGSRDKTAKLWSNNELSNSYSEKFSYKDQQNFVASVLYIEPTQEFPDGLVITGGNDSVILIYKPHEPFAYFTIKEHTNTVSSLTSGILPNTFLSGSWDTSAKLWNISENSNSSITTFSGHAAAVWSVIQLIDSRIVTASADKSICIWDLKGQRLQTLSGHTDCVRGLCDIPESNYFLSVSNDASIKVWSYSGENINTYYGHTNYIYSIAKIKDGDTESFVTTDEDRTVRVWKNGKNIDTFQLPAQSVWAVATLNNGDIVTGSSDGVIRIFTKEESRFADASLLQKFKEEVDALTLQSVQEIGGYKVSDLPGIEALYDPGKTPGQIKMIREAQGVVAYSWVDDGPNSHWEKIGDVMGGTEKSNEGKTMYEGQEYDYVFSVDVEDGKPPLKLPFNLGDDPYKSAQTFLVKNNLPSAYLEQVVDFILKNSKTTLPPMNTQYQDPFTGGSRYTPSGTNTSSFQGTNVDPFTGGSSYSTGQMPSNSFNHQATSGSNADPFTGSMSYTSGGALNESKYFPQRTYLRFDVGDPNVILNKLKEFNTKVCDGNLMLTEHELEEFISLGKGNSIKPEDLNILLKLLQWPDDIIFPILDLVRMAVKYENNNRIISTEHCDILMEKLKYFIGEKCPVINNTIVALRTLTNLCLHEPGEELVFKNRFDILENITSLRNLNKNAQIAVSTLLLNLSILSQKKHDDLGMTILVDVLQEMLYRLNDSEAQFRSYVTAGTLISSSIGNIKKEIRVKFKSNLNFAKLLEQHCLPGTSDVDRKREIGRAHV